jgi:signal transduction histidine kinase
MSNELDHYLSLLTNPYNPIYISTLFILLNVFVMYIIYLKIFIPVKKKYLKDKKRLEYDNLRIIGAFSESDPNPVIRTNSTGDIIHFNKSAQNLFGLQKEKNTNLQQLSPGLTFDFKKEIENNSNIQFDLSIGDRHFSVYFYGIKTLHMARIYLIDHTERIENEKRVIESEQKYRSLSFYLQDHLEEEKERIGLELHDSIGQNLSIVKMKINHAVDLISFQKSISEINDALDQTISDLREILFNLRPKILEDLGLFEAVRMLSDNISRNFNLDGRIEYTGISVRLNKKSELFMFRIIQESLSNIFRHSKADEYFIQFIFSKASLKIHISDNGIGFNTDEVSQSKHYGLLNMSERIKTLNGKMNISSSNTDGTSLFFEIPYDPK